MIEGIPGRPPAAQQMQLLSKNSTSAVSEADVDGALAVEAHNEVIGPATDPKAPKLGKKSFVGYYVVGLLQIDKEPKCLKADNRAWTRHAAWVTHSSSPRKPAWEGLKHDAASASVLMRPLRITQMILRAMIIKLMPR